MLWVCGATPITAAPDWTDAYAATQARLARGWNTWDTRTLLAQVLLPEGLAVNLDLRLRQGGQSAEWAVAQPGRSPAEDKAVALGLHAVDGSYSEMTLRWRGLRLEVQSAATGSELVWLLTPLAVPPGNAPEAEFHAHLLWNRPGRVAREGNILWARLPARDLPIFCAGDNLGAPMGLSTGQPYSVAQMKQRLLAAKTRCESSCAHRGVRADTAAAVLSALGWDTIYDPRGGRVITPVSRSWNVAWGGYVLFDWDTFFAGYMAGFFSRDLAYGNVLEMLNEVTPAGFVPNYASAGRGRSLDRSEPPVGALVIENLYRRFHERWLLQAAFARLLAWNRWWDRHRQVQGFLVWGTDPADAAYARLDGAVDTLQGAKYESGLDNSPLYDDAPFDARRHKMMLADVGLMSLYVADCDALGRIARELGREPEAAELGARAERYRAKLATLWSPEQGMFLNRNLATGAFSLRLSPTQFYPLLARAATAEQARRMVREHLLNPAEFWGEWVLPATPRGDPAFRDQNYWRGRIWGPMNFLVYLGLCNYDFPQARSLLADKSEALLLKSWRSRGEIHENYNAVSGEGADVTSSDPFYSWGALLGIGQMLEAEASP